MLTGMAILTLSVIELSKSASAIPVKIGAWVYFKPIGNHTFLEDKIILLEDKIILFGR